MQLLGRPRKLARRCQRCNLLPRHPSLVFLAGLFGLARYLRARVAADAVPKTDWKPRASRRGAETRSPSQHSGPAAAATLTTWLRQPRCRPRPGSHWQADGQDRRLGGWDWPGHRLGAPDGPSLGWPGTQKLRHADWPAPGGPGRKRIMASPQPRSAEALPDHQHGPERARHPDPGRPRSCERIRPDSDWREAQTDPGLNWTGKTP